MNLKTNSEVLGVAPWQEMRACLLIFLVSTSVCGEGLGRELEGIFGTRQRCGGRVFGNIRALSSVCLGEDGFEVPSRLHTLLCWCRIRFHQL